MSENLYKIAGDLSVVIGELIENGGELSEELEKKLDDSTLAFDKKAENVLKYMLNLDGDIDILDAEIKRLQQREKFRANAKTRLKDYLLMNMIRVDIKKIEHPAFTAVVMDNPVSVEITNEKKIPTVFTEKRSTIYIDKTAIKNALKAGKDVPGAKLIDNKKYLKVS